MFPRWESWLSDRQIPWEISFHSDRSLARTLKIAQTTVWRHLHTAGSVMRNLHIISRTLSQLKKPLDSNQQSNWKKSSRRSNTMVGAISCPGRIMVLFHDNSWIYLDLRRGTGPNEMKGENQQSETNAHHFLVPARFSSRPNSPKEISFWCRLFLLRGHSGDRPNSSSKHRRKYLMKSCVVFWQSKP
jgi:hypothetical protein